MSCICRVCPPCHHTSTHSPSHPPAAGGPACSDELNLPTPAPGGNGTFQHVSGHMRHRDLDPAASQRLHQPAAAKCICGKKCVRPEDPRSHKHKEVGGHP